MQARTKRRIGRTLLASLIIGFVAFISINIGATMKTSIAVFATVFGLGGYVYLSEHLVEHSNYKLRWVGFSMMGIPVLLLIIGMGYAAIKAFISEPLIGMFGIGFFILILGSLYLMDSK